MSTDRPPATGSRHPLPFEKLSPEDFERLCYALVRREGYDAAEHEGAAGADEGCDILAQQNGQRVIFQCKRYPRLSPSDAAAVVDKILDLPADQRPQKLVLIVAGTASHQARERFRERAGSMACEVWARTELDERVHRDPNLLEQFFALPSGTAAIAGDLLELWLHEVAADHQQLTPYFQRQPELDLLQRVYVELQLTAEVDRMGSSAPSELGAPTELREVLDLDPADHPWVTRRWVVLGDPGAGKTTLLRHFTASLAAEPARSWVPVFESLPRLLSNKEEFILDPIGRRMERLGHSGERFKASLERSGREGHLLLLLDGLDEVPRERREEAEEILRGLAQRWPESPLVVTSRPIGYRSPGAAFQEVTLLPLDRERRRDFLARWLGRATGTPDATRAAYALASLDSPELRELAGNPLYLTLMALLFESGIEPDRNRTRLYDQVFALLFEGRHHGRQREPLEAQEAVRAVLRRLAYDMTAEGRDTEPVIGLEKRIRSRKLDGLRVTLERVAGWSQMRRFLDDLSQKTGILGPHDGPAADWRFWHRTFREALTAEQLAEDYRREREKPGLLARLWQIPLPARARKVKTKDDLSRWAEPFALLVGRVDNPDELVRELVETNRPLGLRALATAQNLTDHTLDEILLLTAEWKERREVYLRVPDIVGEPGRALSLLDRLRRRTRNGNDLYFLDQAVQKIARRFPDHSREAAEIHAGLYSHIPPPAGVLFRWIDTPMDGRVPLWREIPAGRFRMGSPEREGYDFERPQHEVTIITPFRFGAAPVTNAQYAAFDPDHKSSSYERVRAEELPYHPVEDITWFEACSFCRWLAVSFAWAHGARLPTEEEWEYACRAGDQTRYWSGDEEDLAAVGWYAGNSGRRTHRVGEKPANSWGLYDVHGNVWEWTLSVWTDSYAGREVGVRVDPGAVKVPTDEAPRSGRRVMRGGSFWDDAGRARSAYRNFRYPGIAFDDRGFRVLLPAGPSSWL